MNKITTAFIASGILIAALVSILYFAIPGVSIALLAKAYNLDISYGNARFTPHFGAKDEKGFNIGVDLRDVRISKKGALADAYENLGALVSAPFDGSLKYREIRGVIRPRSGRILIDELTADGDDIKVNLKGALFFVEERADLDVVIQFSQSLLKKIPRELSEAILKECPGGWKSLSVNLKGSFKSPAIEVTGRLFRLSIKEMSGS